MRFIARSENAIAIAIAIAAVVWVGVGGGGAGALRSHVHARARPPALFVFFRIPCRSKSSAPSQSQLLRTNFSRFGGSCLQLPILPPEPSSTGS